MLRNKIQYFKIKKVLIKSLGNLNDLKRELFQNITHLIENIRTIITHKFWVILTVTSEKKLGLIRQNTPHTT